MQLLQKPYKKSSTYKSLYYGIILLLAISCKPFLYRQGIGFVFDYEVATKRIQTAADWLAFQLASDNKPVVVYGGKK
jgi:hypothetical protein